MVRLLKSFLIGLLASLVVLAPGGVATAHDELLSTDPEDGATVQEAPEELVLTFSGQIAQVGAQLQVTDEDGADVADGDPVVEGTDLVQALTDMDSGDYEVIWRVTSSDGHPISGTFGFTVEAGQEAQEDAGGTTDEATQGTTDEATQGTTDEATEEAAVEATPDATDETTNATTEDATEDATEVATDDAGTVVAEDDNGMPAWVWVVIGVAVLALVALLGRTWSRGRS